MSGVRKFCVSGGRGKGGKAPTRRRACAFLSFHRRCRHETLCGPGWLWLCCRQPRACLPLLPVSGVTLQSFLTLLIQYPSSSTDTETQSWKSPNGTQSKLLSPVKSPQQDQPCPLVPIPGLTTHNADLSYYVPNPSPFTSPRLPSGDSGLTSMGVFLKGWPHS